jgi:putative ABC transport system permease protein
MQHADKGFDTDRVLSIADWSDPPEKLAVYAEAVRHIPGVEQVIQQGTPPMGFAQNMDMFAATRDASALRQMSAHISGPEYIPFYRMSLVAGRNVFPSDSLRELVVNVTTTRQLGCKTPQQAIGRMLYKGDRNGIGQGYPIVGVVADFHVSSFHEPIPPVVIENVPDRKHGLAIRISQASRSAAGVKEILANMEKEWKKIFPDKPFQTAFLEESISWLFQQEQNTAWLVNLAMIVTIFISCMGLFGLGLFTLRRRSKEISIRKVFGASVTNITTLLTKDYLLLVGVAFCIAMPITWYASAEWLADFAYRTSLSWWVFVLAGVIALAVALITIAGQAARAAMVNPIIGLRNE